MTPVRRVHYFTHKLRAARASVPPVFVFLPQLFPLDASALMTFFEDRPGAVKVEEIIARAAEGKCELLMSVVNWGEVYYSVWRAKGPAMARKIVAEIGQLPIELVGAGYELTKLAAELHARHKLPYADCFAAALAAGRKASLATSDKDFARVENDIRILWTTEP